MIPPPNLILNCFHMKTNKRVVSGSSFKAEGKPISAMLRTVQWLLVLIYDRDHFVSV